MEKQLQELQNDLTALKYDVAEIKNLVRELHAVLIPSLNVKKTLTRKEKKELEEQETKQRRRRIHLRLIADYNKKNG